MSWFWPFKSKDIDKEKAKPSTEYYAYETRKFDVGITTALIIFKDGREVHTKFYGHVDQYVPYRVNIEPSPPYVTTSVQAYQHFMRELPVNEIVKLHDDPTNPMYTWTGEVSHVEVVETIPHEVDYMVTKMIGK